ncbi:MAG: ABC transporter permease [Planctomycetota bacterium]
MTGLSRARTLGLFGLLVVALLFGAPVLALLLRLPWDRAADLIGRREVLDALKLSLWTATTSAILAAAFGLPVALWLSSGRGPVRAMARVLVTLPMVLPPVVGGLLLLLAFGRSGVFGSVLDEWFGIGLPFTSGAVITAQAWIAMPFFVLTVENGIRGLDQRPLEAARTLGASPAQAFFAVTLPAIRPTIATGTVIAWARALGEFGATITFAGNLRGETRTMPLQVYAGFQSDPDTAIVTSFVLLTIAVIVLVLSRNHWLPRSTDR